MFASKKKINGRQHLLQGLFEATVMYFGFSNVPATFQSMMNDILGDLIHI